MNYLKTHLKIVLSVLFLAIVLGGFVFYILFLNKKVVVQPLNVGKVELEKTAIPVFFPKDIPIEKGANITQNYNATSPDGRFQATRTFETTKTLDENFKIYQDYFNKNNWEIHASLDQENYKMIYAYKDRGFMQISMSSSAVSGIKVVDMSFTTPNVGLPSTTSPKKQ